MLGALVATAGVVAVAPSPAFAASGRVAVVDQRHGIQMFNLANSSWNGRAPLWSFNRSGRAWSNLSDVRFRSYGGRNTVLVTASGGMAATVDYATRRVTWSQNVGGNPHSMELLPSGAVVIASSAGRLTAYGKGRHTPHSVSFANAHAVLWNAATHRLWALGGTRLCSFAVTGTATSPRLTGRSCVAVPSGAHDLSPVYGSSTRLWFSTHSHVYRYDISRGTRSRAPGYIDEASIKSVGNQPGGLVITSQATHGNSDGTWGTGNVWLYRQNGSYAGNRYRAGAAIYKARPVVWERR
jgi:hypothetical protein